MQIQRIEFTEYHAPDGEIYRFERGDVDFLISETGFGMPGIDYISQQGPFQHGNTIYDYRLQPRVVQLIFRGNSCSREAYWAKRADIMNLLRPNRQLIDQFDLGTLRKILPGGAMRDLNVLIEQGPEFRPREVGRWDEYGVHETLRFIAPDPTFFDPTLHEEMLNFASTYAHLILPFTIESDLVVGSGEMAFDVDATYGQIVINYTGTWLSYPTIIIDGPVDFPVIENLGTGQRLDLSAYNIAAGETVTFTLDFGNKTVVSSGAGNIINYLSEDSDLSTFGIAPDPTAPGGLNTIKLSGENFLNNISKLTVRYYTRYIGI
jgi:hypothetical protein